MVRVVAKVVMNKVTSEGESVEQDAMDRPTGT